MRHRRLLLLLPATLWPIPTLANTGIPGPMMFAFGSQMEASGRWLICTMVMCIGVEAAIYRYMGLFNRPVWTSAYLNFLSLLLGVPLGFLGAFDPTWFVLPTIASALSEGWLASHLPARLGIRLSKPVSHRSIYGRVFLANLVSNVIMLVYLFVAIWKSQATPADYPWLRFILF